MTTDPELVALIADALRDVRQIYGVDVKAERIAMALDGKVIMRSIAEEWVATANMERAEAAEARIAELETEIKELRSGKSQ